jgi:hypothetical protein
VPPTPVDHVLLDRGVKPRDIDTYQLRGTSHRILVADLAVS